MVTIIRLSLAVAVCVSLVAVAGCGLFVGGLPNHGKVIEKDVPADAAASSADRYWYNSRSGILHNSSCRWFGKTTEGYYTNEPIGDDCGICGGAHRAR